MLLQAIRQHRGKHEFEANICSSRDRQGEIALERLLLVNLVEPRNLEPYYFSHSPGYLVIDTSW